jgi:hypothetical protein
LIISLLAKECNIPQERSFLTTQSEVTRLLARIEQEYASARSGLSGLASGTARHAFLTGKMERIQTCYRSLCGLLGTPEATRAVAEHLERP